MNNGNYPWQPEYRELAIEAPPSRGARRRQTVRPSPTSDAHAEDLGGYLFPDSHTLAADTAATTIVEAMVANFPLALNSPYSTYEYAGLLPGPICSPGTGTLIAAAPPTSLPLLRQEKRRHPRLRRHPRRAQQERRDLATPLLAGAGEPPSVRGERRPAPNRRSP